MEILTLDGPPMLALSKNWKQRCDENGIGADRELSGFQAAGIPVNLRALKPVGLGVRRCLFPMGLLCLLFGSAWARLEAQPLPFARLNWVQPAVARAGSAVDLTVQGAELDDPSGLVFSVPGVAVQAKGGNTFAVKFPPGTSPILCDVRFAGRFGLSNPRGFEITDLPVWSVPATNTSAAAAILIPVDTAVFSHTTANALDHFAVQLKKGQRVVVRLLTKELDSRLEPVISVFMDSGRELARARRSYLDFTAPEDARFVVKLQDALFQGGDEYSYRLVVSTAPQVDFVLPNVLRRGQTNRVLLCGRNLIGGKLGKRIGVDGRVLDELEVEVVAPAVGDLNAPLPRRSSASMEVFSWTYRGTNGWSNPLLLGLSDSPGLAGPTTPGATAVSVPVEYTGQFMPRGALSGVQFPAKKGEAFWIEVFAERLGLHSDAAAVVQRQTETKDTQGNLTWTDVMELSELEANIGDRDFNTSSRDCAGRFEAPADGVFRVWVRDLYNLGLASPRHLYQLSIRREAADFRLAAMAVQPPRPKDDNREVHPISSVLRRAGTLAVRVMAFRRGGFGGEIELAASGLPKGMASAAGRILAGQNSGFLFLTAAEDAPAWSGLIQITGSAKIGTNALDRIARAGSVIWHLPDWDQASVVSRPVAGLPLTILESEVAPVVVSVAGGKPLEAPVDGKLTIPVSVLRRGDYLAAFNLKPYGRPELDKAKDVSVPEKGTNATVEINLAELKLPEGTHRIWLQGQCAGKYRKQPEAADAAEKASKQAEKEAADAAAAAKKAADELAALKDPKPDVKSAAEKRSNEAAALAKSTEEKKKSTAQIAKDATERAKPRDVVIPVVSAPFMVKITPASKPADKK